MLSRKISEYLDVGEENISTLLNSNDPAAGRKRRLAVRLIMEAMGNEESNEVSAIDDLICMPLSLWILRRVNEHLLTSRVLNHARDLVEKFILSSSVHDEYVPDYAARYGVKITYNEEDELFSIPVSTFVTYTSRLSGYRYRLVYQNIRNGTVYADRETVAKIIREAFVRKALESYGTIDSGSTERVLAPISQSITEVVEKLQTSGIKKNFDLGEVDFSLFPPCVKEYITQMQDGINLPHMARFTLVSFLHKVGMNNEGIIGLFKTAPDFRESLTTYQVNHVTGEISSTEYSPPKCTVLQSNHLCYMGEDPICHKDWLKHPLQYYTFKKRHKNPGNFRKSEKKGTKKA